MKRILLADDKPEILSSLHLLLETRLDLELITEARDMEHVLVQVKDTHPDGLILDWNLPGRPTHERISVLRALAPDIKIILMTPKQNTIWATSTTLANALRRPLISGKKLLKKWAITMCFSVILDWPTGNINLILSKLSNSLKPLWN